MSAALQLLAGTAFLLGVAAQSPKGGKSKKSPPGPDLEAPLTASYQDKGLVTFEIIDLKGFHDPLNILVAGPEQASKLVVLLHGMAFSSDTWRVTGTMDALAENGFRVVAIECLGYKGQYKSLKDRKILLGNFLEAFQWPKSKKVAVVAASAGGSVGLPYVLEAGSSGVAGYVSIAGMMRGEAAAKTSDVPALLVWGALDPAPSAAHETAFKEHEKVLIPNAPHPCYLKEPELFNAILLTFLGANPSFKPPPGVDMPKIRANWYSPKPIVEF